MPRPNLDRRFLACVFCVSLLGGSPARAGDDFPAPEQAQPVTVDRMASLHAAGVAYLRATLGRQETERLLAATATMPGGLHVVAACIGSFDRPGPSQALLGLATADASRLVYATFLPGAAPQVLWDERPPLGPAGAMPRFPSTRCLSWTAVERANVGHLAQGLQEIVKRRSFMDVACVAPMQSDYAYVCHAWDAKRRRWERIGGWMQP